MFRKIATISLICGFVSVGGMAYADDLQEISNNIPSTPDLVTKGQSLYMGHCMSCHGAEGRGDGPAAVAFNPKPRNFISEKFKQGASPSATFYTITNGLGSMPSFASLSVVDRLALVHYVLSLAPHKENDTPESLAKIGLDPSGKPMAGFKGRAEELPVEFMMERMATDGDVNSINYVELLKQIEIKKEEEKLAATPVVIVPDLKKGESLFNSCKICHGNSGEGSQLSQAPQIAGQDVDYLMDQLKKFQSGIRGAHPEDVNGLKMRPMSRLLQSEKDVIDVAHFVSQLSPKKLPLTFTGGDPEKGKMGFMVCMSCHGMDGKGMKAMKAPSLVHLQDWYVAEQIRKFKAGIRGGDVTDTTGSTMRGMAMGVADEQTLKDMVSYINTLQ
ncbi:MAG: hypothetical protein A2048_05830 [Deltaproteobacteria bacterium GWA2_45_12]|nr:MAG: hypothetical protein A2048_05830 [Deltaproteobacteria bacterium GWA2_45_12]